MCVEEEKDEENDKDDKHRKVEPWLLDEYKASTRPHKQTQNG